MANYSNLIAAINAVIKTNGNNEITGAILQNVLNTVVSTIGANRTFAGIATTATTPGTPDQNVFYIANGAGIYPNFNGVTVGINELAIFVNNASNTWVKQTVSTNIATSDEMDKVNGYILPLYGKADIKYNKAYSFASQDYGEWNNNSSYDAIRVIVPLGNELSISGAIPTAALFFSDYPCGMDNIISHSLFTSGKVVIPEGTKYIGVDFQKSQNTTGYDNMVISFNNSFVDETRLQDVANIISNKSDLINGYVASFGGNLVGRIEKNDLYSLKLITVPNNAKSLKIVNAQPYNGVSYIGYPNNIVYSNILLSTFVLNTENLYSNIPTGAKVLAINFLNSQNPNGYDDMKIVFDTELKSDDLLYNANLQNWKDANKYTPASSFQGWATVVRGLSIPKLDTIFLLPGTNETTFDITVKLYKSVNATLNGAFGQLLETVIVPASSYTAVKIGNILKVPLQNTYNIIPGQYYTVSVEYNSTNTIRWRVSDAIGAYNFIRNGFYKTSTGVWSEVSKSPDGIYNYGMIWGAYIGGETIRYENVNYTVRSFMDVLTYLLDKSDIINLVQDTNYPRLTGTPDTTHVGGGILSMGNSITNINAIFRFINITINAFTLSAGAVVKLLLYRGNGKTASGLTNTLVKEIIIPNEDIIIGVNTIDLGEYVEFSSTDYITVVLYGLNANITTRNAVARTLATDFISGIYTTTSNPNVYIETYSANLYPANYGIYFDIILTENKVIDGKYIPSIYKQGTGVTQEQFAGLTKKVNIIEANTKGLNDIMAKAMTLSNNRYSPFNAVNPKFNDEYLIISGDSITAYQSTPTKAIEGVTRVPAVCDKQAVAYFLWESAKWGNAQYRRFDDGKASLVSGWSDMWTDDTQALFVENGTFNTEYIGAVMREQIPTINGAQVSTLINPGSFPTQFDISENSWWQRNIPKRFSQSANASVQFVIPAGYSKFDFIYHAHILGDNITITTNRNNNIVKVNTKPNDWSNAIEANGYVADLSLSPWIESNGGNDTFGIPNKRLHFQITNNTSDTIVTLTKTSDTDKYLIYWGISYWGTTQLPYCLHLDNMAIGGYTMQDIYNLRGSMFKAMQPTSIILEICFNNLNNETFTGQMESVKTILENLKPYFGDIPVGIWIPHIGGVALRDRPNTVECNYRMADDLVLQNNYNLLGNISHLFADVVKVYFPDTTLSQFMINAGDVHLNDVGHRVYGAFWNSIF